MQQSLSMTTPAPPAGPELSADQADAWDALAEALAQAGVDLVSQELAPPQPGRARVMAVLGKAGSGKTLHMAFEAVMLDPLVANRGGCQIVFDK